MALNFIIMGDWGGDNRWPFTTPIQLSTRDIMDRVASKHHITAVITLGDNYYKRGVKNEYDPRFQQTFERIYNTSNLIDIPWYAIAGDHDWKGNVSAQIEYTKHSSKWNMLHYYYHKIWTIPQSQQTLEVILLDTIIFCGRHLNSLKQPQRNWLEHRLRYPQQLT
eukprot:1104655_1